MDVDESTKFYVPTRPGSDADATNMAVAIRFALRHLPDPEHESDTMRAAGIGALRGALTAHETRIALDPPSTETEP